MGSVYFRSLMPEAKAGEIAFADRFKESNIGVHYKILEYIGGQAGYTLGSEGARNLILDNQCWVWDRTSRLLFDVPGCHEMVGRILYMAHKNVAYQDCDPDSYVDENMGFWLSSVSQKTVHVANNFRLDAQERVFFRGFEFRKW